MRLNKPRILITGDIDEALLNEMNLKDSAVDIIPFIHTENIRTKRIQEKIEMVLQLNTIVVFTSVNAVEAISEYLQNKKPDWKVYCIGNITIHAVENFFGKESVVATADNAIALAEKIIATKEVSEIYFFCGDKKRNELPELLKENNIAVNEIEVYSTTILHHKLEKDYDAILFFSPSAVDGFFSKNTVNEKTILFAIGRTTAAEIKKFTENEIVISDKPGKRELIEKAICFF